MVEKMTKGDNSNESRTESDEHESEDESEILEESPCGRWLKRNEEVSQRNVPGIDRAFLAMDCEEGVEVVWNEVQFSERKSYKAQEEKIRMVFDNLTRIEHANIVKFHRYWVDPPKKDSQKTRVVFITEYMSSGSVKKFLNKTKEVQKSKSSKSWKRWCRQILSALGYLHMCDPPIVHGNLTCDTIFIQHNGLLKIGSVAPDAIRNHVKTYREIHKNLHYFAPECTDTQGSGNITPAVDIFSFGICCLEMAMSKTHLASGESKLRVGDDDIEKAIASLENPQQQNFIQWCISKEPEKRPDARALLLHPLLYEVPSLRLLSAHTFVKSSDILSENHLDMFKMKIRNNHTKVIMSKGAREITKADFPAFDVDKYIEDVRVGIYPLTTFSLPKPPPRSRDEPPDGGQEGKKGAGRDGQNPASQPEPLETRKIVLAQCCFLDHEDDKQGKHIILQLRFEDKMNRQLRCDTVPEDTPESIVHELVAINFVREEDRDLLTAIVGDAIKQKTGVASALTVEEYNKQQRRNSETTTTTVASDGGSVAIEASAGANGDNLFSKQQLDASSPPQQQQQAEADTGDTSGSKTESVALNNSNNSNSTGTSTATTTEDQVAAPLMHPSAGGFSAEAESAPAAAAASGGSQSVVFTVGSPLGTTASPASSISLSSGE